jgi:hypothetical protein
VPESALWLFDPLFIEPFIENFCGLNRIHRQDCIPIYTENKSLVSMTETSNWKLNQSDSFPEFLLFGES